MKVLVVGSLAESLVNFRGDLLRALVAKGHVVVAAAPQGPDWVMTRLADWGIRFVSLPMSRTGTNLAADLRLLMSLRTLFLRERADVSLGYTIKPVIYGSIAAWSAGVPRIAAMITGLGFTFMPATGWKATLVQRVARLLYRAGLACVDTVFFQNGDDEAEFRRAGLLPRRLQVVRINGSGVNLDRYPCAPLPPAPMRFLLVGRLIVDKGVREYIQAAARLRALHPDAQCHLVGPLDENPSALSPTELQAAVNSGVIHYHGASKDVRGFLRDCHVFVLPSYREGTPRSVLEAMSMGRPILTTDAPGCRETVVPGVNGFLVPVRDVAALTKLMVELCETPLPLLQGMGRASRELAEAKYDVHRVNAVITLALLPDAQTIH